MSELAAATTDERHLVSYDDGNKSRCNALYSNVVLRHCELNLLLVLAEVEQVSRNFEFLLRHKWRRHITGTRNRRRLWLEMQLLEKGPKVN